MILTLLLFLAQDAPAPAPEESAEEEIVVRAQFGLTTMLFDKGADGKLRNCRIMVSSGSQRRDTNACQATPVCYAKTADEVTDCREMTFLELASAATPGETRPAGAGVPQAFTLPKFTDPKPALAPGQAGPLGLSEPSRETERQRVKLPPLPKPPSDGPIIRVGPAKELGE
ncbi:hypothetical protein PIB19_12110 [Sphingomonas sp. 7/4-4]|uniref:hypothetical protein n=1 Tax=Sphingomonas sp. 7/4-4 TaxID=3018446 RepID=UPI0022F398DF|nr:hypothetical protein [Sphingomonas sp. 7/4-4]WBY06357.1 hypothetical protein PIB19_12110 [Sphingomonas sp. 7/4-4]